MSKCPADGQHPQLSPASLHLCILQGDMTANLGACKVLGWNALKCQGQARDTGKECLQSLGKGEAEICAQLPQREGSQGEAWPVATQLSLKGQLRLGEGCF